MFAYLRDIRPHGLRDWIATLAFLPVWLAGGVAVVALYAFMLAVAAPPLLAVWLAKQLR